MYKKKGFLSVKVNLFEALLIIILVISLLGVSGLVWYGQYFSPKETEYEWSIGIYISSSHEPFNFTGENINNPILTGDDVTDVNAIFVADPFLIHENNTYYMFFEVYHAHISREDIDIGLAISNDGFNWSYKQIVLDEPFLLSYPYVFKLKNEYYMIPSTSRTQSIRLYKADDFPYRWCFVKTLLKGKYYSDNTIFYYNNTWWLFTETRNNDILRLYYSDSLLGSWTEHPHSPVVYGDANIARPGGNVIVFNNRVIRYTQDCDPYYGNQVWAFDITKLTKENYKEQKTGSKPILKGFDDWNRMGMHTISPYQISDNKWIAAVDGKGKP